MLQFVHTDPSLSLPELRSLQSAREMLFGAFWLADTWISAGSFCFSVSWVIFPFSSNSHSFFLDNLAVFCLFHLKTCSFATQTHTPSCSTHPNPPPRSLVLVPFPQATPFQIVILSVLPFLLHVIFRIHFMLKLCWLAACCSWVLRLIHLKASLTNNAKKVKRH